MTMPDKVVPFGDAERAEKRDRRRRQRDPAPSDDGSPAQEAAEAPDCPVTALGHLDGNFWFFDPRGQLRTLNPSQIGNRAHLDALFCGNIGWPIAAHPGYDREGNPTGDFSVKGLSRDLIRRCARAGLFLVDEPRRGIGVWRGADGVPVLHLGDVVRLMHEAGMEQRDAGFRDMGALWPAHPAIRRPEGAASAGDAARMMALFQRWNWGERDSGGVFFGLWSAHLLGAAVRWRPHGLVVGAPGSGKTTLMEFYQMASPLAEILNDYTEAGIRQSLTGRAGPLLLDEAEGDAEGAARLQKVIELLRRASGGEGARVARGSAGGTAQRFQVMSPAMLGGVLPPVLLPQDASRITRLDVHPPPKGWKGPGLPDADEIAWVRKAAPRLWARALEGIGRLEANFALLHRVLMERGCVPRLGDQLGTILAARAMMLHDEPLIYDQAEAEVDAFAWLALTEEDQAPDGGPQACLTHLLQSPLDLTWNGEKPTVGALVARAAKDDGERERRALTEHGLKVAPPPKRGGVEAWLFVADKHPRLARLFEGTAWASGRWKDDLRRLPGALVPDQPQWIGQAKPRCTVLPPGLLPERDGQDPATLELLEDLAGEFGLALSWVVMALKARWSPRNARAEALQAAAPRPG